MCWIQSKGSFLRISCGDCYFVTNPFKKQPTQSLCVGVCGAYIPHGTTLWSQEVSTAYQMLYSWSSLHKKTDFKATSHQEWWYVRGGESDFFFEVRLIFFFFFRIYLTSLTSSFQEQIIGIDKMIQHKMQKERMRSKGGVLFNLIFFQKKNGAF